MLALPAPLPAAAQPHPAGAGPSASGTGTSPAETVIADAVRATLDCRLRPRAGCAKCAAGLADQNLLKTYNTAVRINKSVDASAKPACALWSHALPEDTLVQKVLVDTKRSLASLGLPPSKLPVTVKAAVRKFMQDKFHTSLLGGEVKSGKTTRNPVQLYSPNPGTGRFEPVDKKGVFNKEFKHYDVYMGIEYTELLAGGVVEEERDNMLAVGAMEEEGDDLE